MIDLPESASRQPDEGVVDARIAVENAVREASEPSPGIAQGELAAAANDLALAVSGARQRVADWAGDLPPLGSMDAASASMRIARRFAPEILRVFGLWLASGAFIRPELAEAQPAIRANGDGAFAGFDAAAAVADIVWDHALALLVARGAEGARVSVSLATGKLPAGAVKDSAADFALAIYERFLDDHVAVGQEAKDASGDPGGSALTASLRQHGPALFAPWACARIAEGLLPTLASSLSASVGDQPPDSEWRETIDSLRAMAAAGNPPTNVRRALTLACLADALSGGKLALGADVNAGLSQGSLTLPAFVLKPSAERAAIASAALMPGEAFQNSGGGKAVGPDDSGL